AGRARALAPGRGAVPDRLLPAAPRGDHAGRDDRRDQAVHVPPASRGHDERHTGRALTAWQDGRVTDEVSFYDAIGGEPTFRKLVDRFYSGVAGDPTLRPMYPEEDLGPAAERLTLFLMQYWGGPNTYSASRGHPRLRMRHAPFKVDPA